MNNLLIDSILQNGKYRIKGLLGQGGFGITYLATMKVQVSGSLGKIEVDTNVAIKEFFMKNYCFRENNTSDVSVSTADCKDLVERFQLKFIKEANNLSKLQHPHIIKVIDVFRENNTVYYVMEYIEGSSLEELVKKQGAFPESKAVEYIYQIASALDYLHKRYMNHLDVKPANILIGPDNKAILIDFGLAKQYGAEGSQTSSTPIGVSIGYAPIEQSTSSGVEQFSAATDIYSLGATFYKLLTGATPPSASVVIEDGLPDLPQTISPKVTEAIKQAMMPSRKKRPQNIEKFLALLNLESLEQPINKEYSPKELSDPLGLSFALYSSNKILLYHNGYSYFLDIMDTSLFSAPLDMSYLKSVASKCKIKSLPEFLEQSDVFLGGCIRALFAYSTKKYDYVDYLRFIEPCRSIVSIGSFEKSQIAALGYYYYNESYLVDSDKAECFIVDNEYCVANIGDGLVDVLDTGFIINNIEELNENRSGYDAIDDIIIDKENDWVIKGLLAEIGILLGEVENFLLLPAFSYEIFIGKQRQMESTEKVTLNIDTTLPVEKNKSIQSDLFCNIPAKKTEKIQVSTDSLYMYISRDGISRGKSYPIKLSKYLTEIPSEVEITIDIYARCDKVSIGIKTEKEEVEIRLIDLIR